MPETHLLLMLIPGLPLAATLLTAALGKRVLRGASHWPVVVAVAGSLVASLLLVGQVNRGIENASLGSSHRDESHATSPETDGPKGEVASTGYEEVVVLWTWADVAGAYLPGTPEDDPAATADDAAGVAIPAENHARPFRIEVTLRADSLTAVMLAMVTFISLLVAVYSVGYMRGDEGYWRFFTYIGLFVFSMTMLVSVSNFILLYCFWEAVGLCSYLLIGFWFKKPEAAAAGKKAFLVNRVGDFGFALGVFLLWTTYGTLDFHDTMVDGAVQTMGILGQSRLAQPELFAGGTLATVTCLLLLLGACGKSAQFPLHVWLPDAMEGPSPVSALIHAATMVTAGVYMVARCAPLYAASVDALHVVAAIGGLTAAMAAFIALTQNDLKRILAYSTISQLGYMFLGLGTGTLLGMTAGMFHLFTHAFFKALLFLGAGSVMHAMGNVIDITRFGGLRRRLPVTHWTFLFGCLALAGIVPFAGFWSKDLILAAVHKQAAHGPGGAFYWVLYVAALATAFATALYTFRAFFRTFYGEEVIPHEAGDHAHESPRVMTWPLIVLALCSLVVGAYFEWTHGFADFLHHAPSLAALEVIAAHHAEGAAATHAAKAGGGHLVVAITSTIVALAGVGLAALLYLGRGGLVDSATRLASAVGLYQFSVGKLFIDQLYNVVIVWPLEAVALVSYWIDRHLVDGLVNFVGRVPPAVGTALRPLQMGLIQFYALAMVLGLLVLMGALLM